jgi:hypothetical protein
MLIAAIVGRGIIASLTALRTQLNAPLCTCFLDVWNEVLSVAGAIGSDQRGFATIRTDLFFHTESLPTSSARRTFLVDAPTNRAKFADRS